MSFLENLFGITGKRFSPPPHEKWDSVSKSIARTLANMRHDWTVALFERFAKELQCTNSALTNDGDVVIRAYQCLYAFDLIAGQGYISPADGTKFTTLVFYDVCERDGKRLAKMEACYKRFLSYRQKHGPAADIEGFSYDLEDCVTNKNSPLMSLVIQQHTLLLNKLSWLATSTAFRDEKTIRKLEAIHK